MFFSGNEADVGLYCEVGESGSLKVSSGPESGRAWVVGWLWEEDKGQKLMMMKGASQKIKNLLLGV